MSASWFSARQGVRSLIPAAVLVGIAAILFSQIAVTHASHAPLNDEQHFGLPTIQFIHDHGRPMVYLYANAYMAPVQEWLASGPFYAMGQSIFIYRVIGAVFVGLFCAALFLHVAVLYSRQMALAVTILVTIPNGALATVRQTQPGYPLGILAGVILFASLTQNFPRSPWLKGALAGLLYYLFPVLAPYLLIYLGVLVCQIADRLGFFSARWNVISLAAIAFGMVPLLPGVYFDLTRGALPRGARLVGMVIGFVWLCAGLLFLLVSRIGLNRTIQVGFGVAAWVIPFLCVTAAHTYVFHKVDEPVLTASHVDLNHGNQYRLQSIGSWPRQAFITVNRTLPMVVSPVFLRKDFGPDYDRPMAKSVPHLILGTMVLAAIIFGSWQLFRELKRDWRGEWPRMLYPAGFLLCFVLMVPSWRLNSDLCIRYIVSTLPGFWIVVIFGIQRFVKEKILIASVGLWAIVALVAATLT